MKTLVFLVCVSFVGVLAFPQAGPPILPGYGDTSVELSPLCKIPKCPLAIEVGRKQPITLPYPLDCLQYVLCEKGEGRVVGCPPDMVYNKKTGECDTRENAKCVPCWQQSVSDE